MTPALKELEVSQGKGAGPVCWTRQKVVMSHLLTLGGLEQWREEPLSACLSQGWIREGLMTAEVLELGFPGQEGGEVGERQRELQGKDTQGRDLRREWEMAWCGWSLVSIKHLDCRSLEGQAKKIGL